MKGTVTIAIRTKGDDIVTDVKLDTVELDATGAMALIWALCDALDLGPTKRAVILHLIASGKLDAELGASKERVEFGG